MKWFDILKMNVLGENYMTMKGFIQNYIKDLGWDISPDVEPQFIEDIVREMTDDQRTEMVNNGTTFKGRIDEDVVNIIVDNYEALQRFQAVNA